MCTLFTSLFQQHLERVTVYYSHAIQQVWIYWYNKSAWEHSENAYFLNYFIKDIEIELGWLGRWKCLATGLDASLSFLSTSWRCSRNRSPSRLPVSPKNFIDGNSALHVSFYNLSTLLQSNRKVTWPIFSQRWYLALAFLIEEVFK